MTRTKVQKQNNNTGHHSFRVTIPMKIAKQVHLENGTELIWTVHNERIVGYVVK